MQPTVIAKYATGKLSAGELNAEIEGIWSDLSKDPRVRARYPNLPTENVFGAVQGNQASGMGLVEGAVGIVILQPLVEHVFAPLLKDILYDLWANLVLPRLKAKLGQDLMGPETPREKRPE